MEGTGEMPDQESRKIMQLTALTETGSKTFNLDVAAQVQATGVISKCTWCREPFVQSALHQTSATASTNDSESKAISRDLYANVESHLSRKALRHVAHCPLQKIETGCSVQSGIRR